MEIYELTAGRIMETARKSGASFDELEEIFAEGVMNNCTTFVRVSEDWLQWVYIDNAILDDPYIDHAIHDEELWAQQYIGGGNAVA